MQKEKYFKSTGNHLLFSLISVLLFIYIILFEFILPANQFLPRPSILVESFPSLFNEYYFTNSFVFTFTIIYSTFLVSYFLIKLFFPIIIRLSNQFPMFSQLFNSTKYFIPLFLILLFELWFGNSMWGEILFVMIIVNSLLKSEIFQKSKKVKEEYVLSAQSLRLNEGEVIKSIYWKSLQPQIFNIFSKNHFPIWSLVLVYEYICGTDGLGALLRTAIKYNDLSLILVTIILSIIIFVISDYLLKQIKLKYFFWEDLDD